MRPLSPARPTSNRWYQLFFLLFCVGFLSACHHAEPVPVSPEPETIPTKLSVSLFLRRGSLVGSDFEQYTLQRGNLFIECGQMQGEKKVVMADRLVSASDKDLSKLSYLADQIQNTTAKFDQRGTGRGVFDPGVYQLSLSDETRTREIVTSLDSIRNGVEGLEGVLREFAERIRGLTENSPCGGKIFYGIKRR